LFLANTFISVSDYPRLHSIAAKRVSTPCGATTRRQGTLSPKTQAP
jgi:hypothetical protein